MNDWFHVSYNDTEIRGHIDKIREYSISAATR